MIIQFRTHYDSKNASCIRFGWIHTDWYEILIIGISSDSIANKAIHIFQYRCIHA